MITKLFAVGLRGRLLAHLRTVKGEEVQEATKHLNDTTMKVNKAIGFIGRTIKSAKDKRKRHVNKAKFQKKAKLKRRKAA